MVKADLSGKVFGSVDGDLAWSISDGQLYGADALNAALKRQAGESAGSYAIEQGSLTAGGNYNLSVVPGRFTITAPVGPSIKPDVEKVDQVRDVISTISVSPKTREAKTSRIEIDGDYRLLNLGMKLPDDLTAEVYGSQSID